MAADTTTDETMPVVDEEQEDTLLMLKFGKTAMLTLQNHTCTRFTGSSHRTKLTARTPPTPGVVVEWKDLKDIHPTLQFYPAQSGYDRNEEIAVMFYAGDSLNHFYRVTCDVHLFAMYDGTATSPNNNKEEFAGAHAITKRLSTFFRTRFSDADGVQFALSTRSVLEEAGIPLRSQQ